MVFHLTAPLRAVAVAIVGAAISTACGSAGDTAPAEPDKAVSACQDSAARKLLVDPAKATFHDVVINSRPATATGTSPSDFWNITGEINGDAAPARSWVCTAVRRADGTIEVTDIAVGPGR